MNKNKIKKPLVIFELANNHMGKISHAKNIIKDYYNLSKKFNDKINFAIKFQYRNRDTFIHETFKNSNEKTVLRFKSTFLSKEEWRKIIDFSRNKFKLICTPFDESSVTKVINDKFDFLKIASCSATDWPLVEFIKKKASKKKIICSLGGLSSNEISKVISFFSDKNINISFLYCVAKYPTAAKDLNLSYFKELNQIYPNKVIGISLHEDPYENMSGAIGYSMGARIFEKHIGVSKGKIKLNKYSTDVNQMEKWLQNLGISIEQVGEIKARDKNLNFEKTQLRNFKRGVYLKSKVKKFKGEKLKLSDINLNFPVQKNQLTANDLSKFKDFRLKKNIKEGDKILFSDLLVSNKREKISEIREKIRQLVFKAKLIIPKYSRIEISHHYGLNKFYKFGLCMITIVNKIYCKKYLFLVNKQNHPAQYHKMKEETFVILYGKILLKIKYQGKLSRKILIPGDTFTIKKGMIHEFESKSLGGAVIEEISTQSIKSDSYYLDKKILKNKNRKSFIAFY